MLAKTLGNIQNRNKKSKSDPNLEPKLLEDFKRFSLERSNQKRINVIDYCLQFDRTNISKSLDPTEFNLQLDENFRYNIDLLSKPMDIQELFNFFDIYNDNAVYIEELAFRIYNDDEKKLNFIFKTFKRFARIFLTLKKLLDKYNAANLLDLQKQNEFEDDEGIIHKSNKKKYEIL